MALLRIFCWALIFILRTSIIALNMVQLTPEQRTFVIKTFYETSTLQQTRGAFGCDFDRTFLFDEY